MSRKIIMIYFAAVMIFAVYPYISLSDIQRVDVTHISIREKISELEVNGTIESAQSIPVKFSYPVYIKKCFVKNNDFVNKGQLMFELDIEKMKNAAKANDFTDYIQVYSSTDSAVFSELSDKIYASDNGFVTQLCVEDNTVVLSGQNLCEIDTKAVPYLKITLNQNDYQNICVGDALEFSTLIMPSKKYYGVISNRTASIRKETSVTGSKPVVDVYADILNEDDNIVSGLQVSGKIINNENKLFASLPYEYINQDEKGEYVYIFNNGYADKVYIETGTEYDKYTEVKTVFGHDTLFIKNNYDGKADIIVNYDME